MDLSSFEAAIALPGRGCGWARSVSRHARRRFNSVRDGASRAAGAYMPPSHRIRSEWERNVSIRCHRIGGFEKQRAAGMVVGLGRPGWVLDTSTIARSIHGPGRSISRLGPKMICLGLDFLSWVDYMFSFLGLKDGATTW